MSDGDALPTGGRTGTARTPSCQAGVELLPAAAIRGPQQGRATTAAASRLVLSQRPFKRSACPSPEDGWKWHKYGAKALRVPGRTRSYYKCGQARWTGCTAKKTVDIPKQGGELGLPGARTTSGLDSEQLVVYINSHNHPPQVPMLQPASQRPEEDILPSPPGEQESARGSPPGSILSTEPGALSPGAPSRSPRRGRAWESGNSASSSCMCEVQAPSAPPLLSGPSPPSTSAPLEPQQIGSLHTVGPGRWVSTEQRSKCLLSGASAPSISAAEASLLSGALASMLSKEGDFGSKSSHRECKATKNLTKQQPHGPHDAITLQRSQQQGNTQRRNHVEESSTALIELAESSCSHQCRPENGLHTCILCSYSSQSQPEMGPWSDVACITSPSKYQDLLDAVKPFL